MFEWIGGGAFLALLLVFILRNFELSQIRFMLCGFAGLGILLSFQAESVEPNSHKQEVRASLWPLAISFWSGMQFFFAQAILSQFIAQSHTNSITAYGTVLLAMVMVMPISAYLSKKINTPWVIVGIVLIGTAWIPISKTLFEYILAHSTGEDSFPWRILAANLIVLGPVSVGASMLFPYIMGRVNNAPSLYAINLVGGIVGVLAAGMLALPLMGIQNSLVAFSVSWGIVGLLLVQNRVRWLLLIFTLISPVAWLASSSHDKQDYQVVDARDGWDGLMQVVSKNQHLYLLSNGSYSLGGTRAVKEERFQATMPLLLRPHAESIFVLGLGTGITAGALINYPKLKSIEIAELSNHVIELSKLHFQPWQNSLFHDSRVNIYHNDARIAIQGSPRSYDLILGDLFLPWLPGAELLMTKEHFESVQKHLTKHGLFVQWLPLYQLSQSMVSDVIKTMLEIFPDVYLFHDGFGFEAPAIALVAPNVGSNLFQPGIQPAVLETYIGNGKYLNQLETRAQAWTSDNRIERLLKTSGVYPGLPHPKVSLTGESFLNWIALSFRSNPPEFEPGIQKFGPEAWRYAAKGFFLQQSAFYAKHQDWQNAELMARRADIYGPRRDSTTVPNRSPAH